MGKPHALVVPAPYQGHVIPLMELSHRLIHHGFKVTFVNTHYNHSRVISAPAVGSEGLRAGDELRFVSIPDGLSPEDDRNDVGKALQALWATMPDSLEELIKGINQSEKEKLTCVVADEMIASVAITVAHQMGIRSASFWPASAGTLASILQITELMKKGLLDQNGSCLTKEQSIRLSPDIPEIKAGHMGWNWSGKADLDEKFFEVLLKNCLATQRIGHMIICNSFHAIEAPALDLIPNSVAIGPLISTNRPSQPTGHFWPDDWACLDWLDRQKPGSVVYAAFGSMTMMNREQLGELALGLELTGRPFLWVARPGLMHGDGSDVAACLDELGYEARVGNQGRVVKWAPQARVLAHPSIACFLSHCGWNSTLEGLCNGVPFLCWPYFCDQFLNQSYVCEVWRVGVALKASTENGIITKEEIKSKVEFVMDNQEIKARSVEFKKKALEVHKEGGDSSINFGKFVEAMRSSGE